MISADVIAEAVRLLVADGRPTRVVLFGSYARGDARDGSDLDLLVVLPEINGKLAETNRLSGLLRRLLVPIDVVVTTEEQLAEWGGVPGTLLYDALVEGKVVYAAA